MLSMIEEYARKRELIYDLINRTYAQELLSIIQKKSKEKKTKIVYNLIDSLIKFLCKARFYNNDNDNDNFALSIFVEIEKLDNDFEYYDDYVI